jgi:hypothetical protein
VGYYPPSSKPLFSKGGMIKKSDRITRIECVVTDYLISVVQIDWSGKENSDVRINRIRR